MKNNFSISDQVRLFGMKNLQLETDLLKLEKSGMDIGHLSTIKTEEIVDPELFELDIRKSAEKMANYYVLYYCLENTIRRTIHQTLSEKYGSKWWEEKIPDNIKKDVKDRQVAEKDSLMTIRDPDNPLVYTTLGELSPIIEENWDDFSDQFRSRKALRKILTQLNQSRIVIAHSSELEEDEVTRMELLIKDWQRIQS